MTNVLITGASGFLGKHFLNAFDLEKYSIYTLGRKEASTNHQFWDCKEQPKIENITFEKVIHIAGKAHSVPRTEQEKQVFFEVNDLGTERLLQTLGKLTELPRQFIFISTSAVYGQDRGNMIDEKMPLQGATPYALSKINAERKIEDWSIENNVPALILRLPLIAGKNPPGNLGSIAKAISKSRYFRIGNNDAKKSVVLAQDVADFIEKIPIHSGTYNLTDGVHPSFFQIESAIELSVNSKIPFSLPRSMVSLLCMVGNTFSFFPLNSARVEKMTSSLTFDDKKARTEIGWNPNSTIEFLKNNNILDA